MTTINVTTRDGDKLQLESSLGGSLMETLRDNSVGVEAICGGAVSCATCHVYIDPNWQSQLSEPGDFEQALLGDLIHTKSGSRLSCQIELTEELNGLSCEVAPYED